MSAHGASRTVLSSAMEQTLKNSDGCDGVEANLGLATRAT